MFGLFIDGETAYELYKAGEGTDNVQQLAAELKSAATDYEDLASELGEITELMREAVKGGTGDAAAESTKPIMQVLQESAALIDASYSVTDAQSQMWHDASNSVQRPPPAPTEPSAFDQALLVVTGRGDQAGANQASYGQAMEQRQRVLQHNVDTYNSYGNGTSSLQGHLPTSYPQARDVGGEVTIATPKDSETLHRTTQTPGVTAAAAAASPAGTGASPGSYGGAPAVGQSGGTPAGGSGSGLAPGGSSGVANPNAPGGTPTGPGGANPAPRPGGLPIGGAMPIGGTPAGGGAAAARRSGTRAPGAPGPRAAEKFAGQRLTGNGVNGPKAGGAAPGAGAKAGTGMPAPGKGSGVGVPGSGPGGAAAAQAAKGGVAGGRGGAGVMGGAGAGRGQGDDDKEHKDKYFVKEELDAGLQVEVDEYGERLYDETTGNSVVPPVIGKAEYEQDDSSLDK